MDQQQTSDNTNGSMQSDTSLLPTSPLPIPQKISDATSLTQQNDNTSIQNTSQVGQKNNQDSPDIAEDVDLIEKEWVNKAKKIVANTKNDPSEQNIQLNKFKADYLKTRFSKDIKSMDK